MPVADFFSTGATLAKTNQAPVQVYSLTYCVQLNNCVYPQTQLCQLSAVGCRLSPVTCHLSPVTCHLSPVTCHQSPVTCHLSPVTCHANSHSHRQTDFKWTSKTSSAVYFMYGCFILLCGHGGVVEPREERGWTQ